MGKWKANETVAVNGAKNAGSSSICAVPSKVYDGQMSSIIFDKHSGKILSTTGTFSEHNR